MVFSSMNPSSWQPVENWLTIYNPGSQPFSASVAIYDRDGAEVPGAGFFLDSLQPGERRDFAVGHPAGQQIGLYKISPADVAAPYAWHYPAGSMGRAALGERTHAMSALREALTQGPQSRGDALVAAEVAAGRPLRFSLRHGPAAEVVVEEAGTFGADLIAIGTYGSSGVRRLLLGSVASQIMRHAGCSVLVTHA